MTWHWIDTIQEENRKHFHFGDYYTNTYVMSNKCRYESKTIMRNICECVTDIALPLFFFFLFLVRRIEFVIFPVIFNRFFVLIFITDWRNRLTSADRLWILVEAVRTSKFALHCFLCLTMKCSELTVWTDTSWHRNTSESNPSASEKTSYGKIPIFKLCKRRFSTIKRLPLHSNGNEYQKSFRRHSSSTMANNSTSYPAKWASVSLLLTFYGYQMES